MAKRMFAFLMLLFIVSVQILPISAVNQDVVDMSDFLTPSQIDKLQGLAETITDKYSMEPVIVITNTVDGKSSMAYADDYFDYNGYGVGSESDGILMLVNMEDRELWLSTTGSRTIGKYESLTDKMVDIITPYLTNGDYYGGCKKFLDMVDSVESTGKLTSYSKRLINMTKSPIPYIAGLLIALIVTAFITLSSKGKVTITNRTYESVNSFHLTNQVDRFEREYITKRKIETNKSGGGGTHTGSSGSSHGGSGGGF